MSACGEAVKLPAAGGQCTPAVPHRTCPACGEFLPYACAPTVTVRRQPFTGRRLITITGRPAGDRDAA